MSTFVGIYKLKETHKTQIQEFDQWASQKNWNKFHNSHYDWWTFPLDHPSSYGLAWTVYESEIQELKKDEDFLNRYLKGVQLVSASWGWDIYQKSYISNQTLGQGWHNWPIRLYKAAYSVQLFGYEEIFFSLQTYALDLIKEGQNMQFNNRDLSSLFTKGINPYQRN